YGIIRINAVWMLSFAVKKEFFGDKLSCTIGMDDVFGTMKFHTHSQFGNQDWNYYVSNDTRRINMSISYNFGRVKAEERDVNSNDEEKERLNH
ncbi:MAG TPA: outer membrane beta-barrel protein, partial [Bacteroidia bacterium]|nr:outer membrane beta-barrel protein [Bacteroidia bacterium]